MGSVPAVTTKRAFTWAPDTVHASLGWWHVLQVRPLVPSCWKKGPVKSTRPLGSVVYVSTAPLGSTKGNRLGRPCRACSPDEPSPSLFWLRDVPIISEETIAKANKARLAIRFRYPR